MGWKLVSCCSMLGQHWKHQHDQPNIDQGLSDAAHILGDA